MARSIRLRRLGRHVGTTDIEPSCGVLDVLDGTTVQKRVVVDCGAGLHRLGGVTGVRGPDLSLFQDGRLIDAVLLTHAHHDHMGCLPALAPFLAPDAGIWMTKPTAAALRVIWRGEIDSTRPLDGPKPYTKVQVQEALRRIRTFDHAGEHQLPAGLFVWVHPAGHISGACSYTVRAGRRLVHYSGDRCDHDQPGVLGCPSLPDEWRPDVVAGSDCTYGADVSVKADWRSEMDRCVEVCREALRDGRRALLYTFALHRAGVIAHELQREGLCRIGQVYVDGSAGDYARLFTDRRHFWCDRDRPFVIDEVGLIHDRSQRERICAASGGCVIIAPPGMGGPGGSGTWWRREFLPDPDAVTAFTGYVAAGTDGDIILRAEAERLASGTVQRAVFRETDRSGKVRTVSLPLRCRLEHFRLGGHNDRQGTMQWFRDTGPEIAVLSHGSVGALTQIQAELAGSGIRLVRADLQPELELDI